MSVDPIYLCDTHGYSNSECCKHAENTGWIETVQEGYGDKTPDARSI